MKQKKKNRFFTFILSFLPGAAEMYMGFMKKGTSIMTLFFASIAVAVTLGLDALIFATGLLWFFGFFHARNLVSSDEEVFMTLEDDFIWSTFVNERNIQISNPTLRKWGARILIVLGVVMLWENFSTIIYRMIPDGLWEVLAPVVDTVPEIVIAVLFIFIGLCMIRGKKEELDGSN